MPRPKKPGVEPKRRSRNGCWPCKSRKVKCGEEKPSCTNCQRQGEKCDYSIRLNWGGRSRQDKICSGSDASNGVSASPYESAFVFEDDSSRLFPLPSEAQSQHQHARSASHASLSASTHAIDPTLMRPIPHIVTSPEPVDGNPFFQAAVPSSAPYSQAQYQTTFDARSFAAPAFDAFSSSSPNFASADGPMPPPSQSSSTDPMLQRQKYGTPIESPGTVFSDAYSPRTVHTPQDSAVSSPGPRRVSVQSLVNDLHGDRQYSSSYHGDDARQYPIVDAASTTYGYDLGLPDLDTPRNDDASAIAVVSPQNNAMDLNGDSPYDSSEAPSKPMAFERGGYYASPVPIRIAKTLEPLPPLLIENQMNLLYFHHFLNHTARILVPHDCERNPLRNILPQMALQDEPLLGLLLAYSASHRAHMLHHPEPANRIAVWVENVFPKLRQTLNENPNDIPDSTLAAVIMMASLEIISSDSFEVHVSWQNHLTMARQMIIQRGGLKGMDQNDSTTRFLSRWFAYLDVVGSLSGHKNDMPFGSFYWSIEKESTDEDFGIDCLMGFSTHCVGSLARISELAKRCEPLRIDENGNIRPDWVPSHDIVDEAIKIRRSLEEGISNRNPRRSQNHRCSLLSKDPWDAAEIYATNELFHWAGLISLHRRVLGKTSLDPEVQYAVRQILELLGKIRRGTSAEACSIFPMFAAGCEAQDEDHREQIMERLKGVEQVGLNQVRKITKLIKSVWETGKPWESLVSGEFFG
ncbi:uncharacterized protein SETTUDRAFT_174460 [Exserohilum turcica Et28A]|uniref:Zn(2)-C6 fungal-type domain-containing protein n=1 Tax=Exserohilum turcicum (strain 28A) TaxID=671987 RepID=R0JT90_EXST2|nr:uncharacterized protein SETTUDRAFT_174460 [Exserohilum turcica Et28A]EOA80749.1 hypothetical protein SETTUDRAFT_174460 [Exserohilum turcica Et28A]